MLRWLVLGWAVGATVAVQSAPALADSDSSSDASLTASANSSGNSSVTDERVAQLSAIVTKPSSNEKAKLSAIAALGRLGDRRAVRPLVAALNDSSVTVRALAAVSLGKLGQKSALSSLRQASSDESETVRARVADAIVAISKANGLTPQATTASTTGGGGGGAGFGRESRVTEQNPDLYVVMKSCNDDSPGRAEKKDRLVHAEVLRATMMSELRAAPLVTSAATEAKRLSLHPRMVDVSVTKMILRTKGKMLEVETELRLAISDDNGKMLSFISGGAKVQVPKKGFNWSYLPNLRKEALENAVRGLFGKLVAHLRSTVAA